ncbi:MAG: glycoside hydrolase family 28 protein [Prevotellaceae bacterium]|nr:glycoside hydrolase family 28 protein [Prevotellaceae bacterium]
MNKTTSLIAAIIALFATAQLSYAATGKFNDSERINRRDSILSLITGAKIPENTVSITKFGAKGDGIKDCKPAFDKAMRKAEKQGGMHITVPAGTYYIKGPIHFTSNVCLEIMEGATLKFAPEPEYYLPMVKTSWEGTFVQNYSPFIYGYNLHDVSIIGKGVIDGNASTTFATWRAKQKPAQKLSRDMNHKETPVEERNFGEGHFLRPQLIQFYGCKNITLEGVFITNSPFWCVHLLLSENIICRKLRYDAKLVNNDGIDPEYSRNILIEDVEFNNGDDNVAIKCGRDNDGWATAMPSENIIIRGCRFKGLHAVVLGSEMSAGVQNVFVENCTYAGYCKRGIYIKTNPDRGGFIRNVYVNNCEFDEVEDLFYVTSMYAGEGLDNTHFTTVENLHVDNLRCKKVREAALVLQGTKAKPINNVSFNRIEVGEVKNAVSFDDAINVSLTDSHLGGKAGVPTQITKKDNIFK